MNFPVTLQELQNKNDIFCEQNKVRKNLGELTKSDYNYIARSYLQNQEVLLEGVLCNKKSDERYDPVYFTDIVEMYGFRVEKVFHEPKEGENLMDYFMKNEENNIFSIRGTFFVFRLNDKNNRTMNSKLKIVYQQSNLVLTWDDITYRWIIKIGYQNKNMWIVFETNPMMSFQLYDEK